MEKVLIILNGFVASIFAITILIVRNRKTRTKLLGAMIGAILGMTGGFVLGFSIAPIDYSGGPHGPSWVGSFIAGFVAGVVGAIGGTFLGWYVGSMRSR